jgi:hypothetical protein
MANGLLSELEDMVSRLHDALREFIAERQA